MKLFKCKESKASYLSIEQSRQSPFRWLYWAKSEEHGCAQRH